METADLLRALSRVPSPVTVVTTAAVGGAAYGFTAGSFSSASPDPPLVLVRPDKGAGTRAAFTRARGRGPHRLHPALGAGRGRPQRARGPGRANLRLRPGPAGVRPFLPPPGARPAAGRTDHPDHRPEEPPAHAGARVPADLRRVRAGDRGVLRALRRGGAEPAGVFAAWPEDRYGRPAGSGPRSEMSVLVADLDTTLKELAEAAVPLSRAPADTPWGERIAYVTDPDGNPVAVACATHP